MELTERINKHPNGKPSSITRYKGLIRHGAYEEFRSDGSLSFTMSYNNGLADGITLKYDNDGILALSSYYSNGLVHGLTTRFIDGKPFEIKCYKHNNILWSKNFNYTKDMYEATGHYYNINYDFLKMVSYHYEEYEYESEN